jgi:hypothetical protein
MAAGKPEKSAAPRARRQVDLAVKDRRRAPQLSCGRDDLRVFAGPVRPAAAEGSSSAGLHMQLGALAVELHLVKPAIACRRGVDKARLMGGM